MKLVLKARLRRVEMGLSQDELGQMAGVDQSIVSRAERALRVSERAKSLIAESLGSMLNDLFPAEKKER